jgi:hypothetical protein
MKIRFNIWVIFVAAMIGLIGLSQGQGSNPETGKTITLETGEVLPDLTGEWDAVIENYGVGMVKTIRGTFTNTIKITQEGSLFKGIRLEPEGKRAKGSMFMQGELDKNGFKAVYYIDLAARLLPCTGEISKGGNTIMIDEGFFVRAKLTRK